MSLLSDFAHYRLEKIFKNIQVKSPSVEVFEKLTTQGALEKLNLSMDFFKWVYEKAPAPIFEFFANKAPSNIKPQIMGWALTQSDSAKKIKELIEKGADLNAVAPNGLPAWLALSKFSECVPEFKTHLSSLSMKDFSGEIEKEFKMERMEWVLQNSTLEAFSFIIDMHTGPNFCLFLDKEVWDQERNEWRETEQEKKKNPHSTHSPHNLVQYILLELRQSPLTPQLQKIYEEKFSFLIKRDALTKNKLGYPNVFKNLDNKDGFQREWGVPSSQVLEDLDHSERSKKINENLMFWVGRAEENKINWTKIDDCLREGGNLTAVNYLHSNGSLTIFQSLLSNLSKSNQLKESFEKIKELFETYIPDSQKVQQASLLLRVCQDHDLGEWLLEQGAHLKALEANDSNRKPTSYYVSQNCWSLFKQLVKQKIIDINDPTPIWHSSIYIPPLSLGMNLALYSDVNRLDEMLEMGFDAEALIDFESYKSKNATQTFSQLLIDQLYPLRTDRSPEHEKKYQKLVSELSDMFSVLSRHHVNISRVTSAYPKTPIEKLEEEIQDNVKYPKVAEILKELFIPLEKANLNGVITEVVSPDKKEAGVVRRKRL